jgi:large subunit ribosomal protein L23
MFNFLKNPFKKGKSDAPRKSAQKELEDQKDESKKSPVKVAEKKVDKKSEPKKEEGKKGEKKTNLEAGFGIILKPHVSEKTARAGTHDTYAFVVHRNANKIQIKKAFWKIYGIEPIGIQVVNTSARKVQFRRVAGVKGAWKKAYIRVPKGSNLEIYEAV